MSNNPTEPIESFRATLNYLVEKVDALDARLYDTRPMWGDVQSSLNRLEKRLETIEGRLETIDERLETVEMRLDRVEGVTLTLKSDFRQARNELKDRVEALESKVS